MRVYGQNKKSNRMITGPINNTLILGDNSIGKTELAVHLAISDFRSGRLVVFVSPSGTAPPAIKNSFPVEKQDSLLYIEPSDLADIDPFTRGRFVVVALGPELQVPVRQAIVINALIDTVLATKQTASIFIDPLDTNGLTDRLEAPVMKELLERRGDVAITFCVSGNQIQAGADILASIMDTVIALRSSNITQANIMAAAFFNGQVAPHKMAQLDASVGYISLRQDAVPQQITFPSN